ncbi:hypothetical protein LCGC14_0267660 [marine sediment metagenome]|uniref:Uncharacterized protein n=1 Tax=marine sediment metagenome TaxID=412755 RepID=A0A0F9U033_9ZZZZ
MITITKEEYSEVIRLSAIAANTPVITMDGGKTSMADHARESVNACWKKLGAKYGFPWDKVISLSSDTFEIKLSD